MIVQAQQNMLSVQVEGDEGWEDVDDDDDNQQGVLVSDILNQFAPASDFPGFETGDDDVDEDDPDAFNDPVYQIDLQVISQLMNGCCFPYLDKIVDIAKCSLKS